MAPKVMTPEFFNAVRKFILSIAFLKLSRYKDFGNARKLAAISGLVFMEFITIHNTGKIKMNPNMNIPTVPEIFFLMTLRLHLSFPSDIELDQRNHCYDQK